MVSDTPDDPTMLLLERYRVEGLLGEGGLGTVVRAFDTRLKRPVAIKTLKRTATRDTEQYAMLEERFTREAEAGSRVGSHPNLVTVHDLVSDADGTFYLILEYVPGGTLADRLMREPLPLADALRLTADIARGLHAAHRRGLVHRDVKPANIFLGEEGQAQVGDFGIAQIDDLSSRTHGSVGHPGTPLYMSPEQSSTTDYLRPASDQYSLGLVLFEMLTGTAYKRLAEPAAAARLAEQPQPVVALIERMLAPGPADRYPSMGEVGQEVRRIMRDYSLTTTHEVPRGDGATTVPSATDPHAETIPTARAERDTPRLSLEPALTIAESPTVSHASILDTATQRSVGTRRFVPALIAVALILVIVGIVTAGIVSTHTSDSSVGQRHYDAGAAAEAAKDYDTAIAEFTAAGQYRDAPQRVTVLQQRRADAQRDAERQQAYGEGKSALAREDYGAAAAAFTRAGTYLDAPQQLLFAQNLATQQRQYQAGDGALAREDYTTAALAFRTAGTYRDAPARAMNAEELRDRKVAYDAGAAAFAKEDFKTATQQFLAAADYRDASQRAAQAAQEDALLIRYTNAQTHLKANQFPEAYADLRQIKQQRDSYKDVNQIIGHLEKDVANPIHVDLYAALNQSNGYKEAWLPVNNLIGQPVAYLYIFRTLSYDSAGRPDLIAAINVYLVAQQGSRTFLSAEIATFATSAELQDRNLLRPDQRLFIVASNGQVFETTDYGAYHAKYTVTSVTVQARATVTGNQVTPGPVFSRLILDVTLTPK